MFRCGLVGTLKERRHQRIWIVRGMNAIDGLVTGFHEPRASHLDLLETVSGKELLERSYVAALEHCYLWHEFGDSQLILP